MREAVNASGVAKLVEANVGFTRPDIPRQETLLVVVYVQRMPHPVSDAEIRQKLVDSIRGNL